MTTHTHTRSRRRPLSPSSSYEFGRYRETLASYPGPGHECHECQTSCRQPDARARPQRCSRLVCGTGGGSYRLGAAGSAIIATGSATITVRQVPLAACERAVVACLYVVQSTRHFRARTGWGHCRESLGEYPILSRSSTEQAMRCPMTPIGEPPCFAALATCSCLSQNIWILLHFLLAVASMQGQTKKRLPIFTSCRPQEYAIECGTGA